MTDEIEHENGDVYPQHFAKSDTPNGDILRHLCPYVFSKNQSGRRSDFIGLLISYHEQLTGIEVEDKSRVSATSKKALFGKESLFFKDIEGFGNYQYIGASYSDGLSPTGTKAEPEEPSVHYNYIPDQHINAKDEGRESLYLWWHKDSEELAKLQGQTRWAMKVGKHVSPNVGARFENYKVAIPHAIRLGLTVSCLKCSRLEKAVHTVLDNRGLNIGEEGTEWYFTSVDEVLEVLRFQHLIE